MGWGHFWKIFPKKFLEEVRKTIFGKIWEKNFVKIKNKKLGRGVFPGGAWCWGAVWWGINGGKVRNKYVGEKFRGGKCWCSFEPKQNLGRQFFWGGAFRNIFGPLFQAAPQDPFPRPPRTPPPPPPTNLESSLGGGYRMGPGLPPPPQGWPSLQWGWEGGSCRVSLFDTTAPLKKAAENPCCVALSTWQINDLQMRILCCPIQRVGLHGYNEVYLRVLSRGTEHSGFPPSAPRLGNQRHWYVQPRLCDWAYKRSRPTLLSKREGDCLPVVGFLLVSFI